MLAGVVEKVGRKLIPEVFTPEEFHRRKRSGDLLFEEHLIGAAHFHHWRRA
jgi:hypothetical protein